MSSHQITQKLYFQNPYQTEFRATVIDQVQRDGKVGLVLDRTAFYPTGGGQPHDTGTLDGYRVVDVIEEGDQVIHFLEGDYSGEAHIIGKVDWQRRFDHMQQHLGQHILSAVLKRDYGWETVGFHLGLDYVTIDVTTADSIPFDEVENKVNEIILRNMMVETQFVAREDLDAELIRKVPGPDPFIRLVQISEIDINACCGTHPAHTSEVGMLKLLDSELIRGNRRIYFVAGWRALKNFQQEHHSISQMAQSLKTNTNDVGSRLQALKEENEQLKKDVRRMSEELIHWEALDWRSKSRALGSYQLHIHTWPNRPFQELKDLAKAITESEHAIVIFATRGPKTQVVLACSAQVPFSMMELANELAPAISGRGGGSRVFAQVGGEEEHLDSALEAIEKRLQQLNESM